MENNTESGESDSKKNMIISDRKLTKTGNSISITIPPKWLEQHNLKEGDEITIMLNSDIKVLSPKSREEFYLKSFKEKIDETE